MSTPYTKKDFKVGQEVVLGKKGTMGNYWRGSRAKEDHTEDVVTKVGTKYITTRMGKFAIEKHGMFDVTNAGFDLYPNMEEFKKVRNREVISEKATSLLRNKAETLTDEQIFAIAEIMGIQY